MTESHSSCEFCTTGFACARLATALRLLDADPTLPKDEERRRRLVAIKGELDRLGWNFPDGGHACQLAGHQEQVRGLTDELIDLLDARKHGTTPPAECDQSLYDEEMAND